MTPHSTTSGGPPFGSGGSGQRPGGSGPTGSGTIGDPRALRRMVGGLSFALVMLGLLAVFGILALGGTWWAAVGAVPLLVGAAGIVAVRWRLARAFRDHPELPRTRTPGARWFWLPGVAAVLGAGALVMAYWMPPLHAGQDPVLVRNHVMLWAEIGLVLLLAASLGAGLIALALWSTPDDSEAILRRTDYARQRRERDLGRDSSGPDLYDSDWIRGH